MRLNPFLLAAACLLLPALTARAEEPPLRELLRDGLYTEEVTRDPEAAAKQYEQLLARYSEQRDFAAAALFRLAEVRRKQERKEDAVKLYQRLLAEFPGAAAEGKLARENLAALGGKPPQTNVAPTDEEAIELARLQAAAKSSPDVLLAPDALDSATSRGWTKVVKFLLAAGSPRYESRALQNAAETGNLEIIKLLLADGGPVPEKVATAAIMRAIANRRYTTLDFLLKSGLKPGLADEGYGLLPLLATILLTNDGAYQAVEILMANGADIDEMVVRPSQAEFVPNGTALAMAVLNGRVEAAKWLLERGAKPDLPDPTYGLTPLHYAALAEFPGTVEMLEKLLAAGADPNRVSADKETNDEFERIIRFNATPLESAIGSRSMTLEKTKLLLKHSAKPNREDSRVAAMLVFALKAGDPNVPELIEALAGAGFSASDPALMKAAMGRGDYQKIVPLLLKHGANPNAIGSEAPLLQEAAKNGNVELVKMLLEAGADLNFQDIGKTILWDTATASNSSSQDRVVECLKLLVAAGAKPPEGSWLKSGFNDVSPIVRRYLTEQFILPNLIGGPDITLAIDAAGGFNAVKLAGRQDGIDVPDLASVLWASQSRVRIIQPTSDTGDYQWSILRKGEDGKIERVKFDLPGAAPLPALQWGDLVEMRLEKWGGSIDYSDGFPPEITSSLRKRISFPVTVEIEGRSREIRVRGDRVIFDPTLDDVPLCDAQKLVAWLWPQPSLAASYATILATRKGWPEVRLAYGSKEARKFQIQTGDHVKLEIPAEMRDALTKFRRRSVALEVPGLPFRRDFGTVENDLLLPVSVPTLIQAIVETQVPGAEYGETWKSWSDRATLDAANLLYAPSVFNGFTLLPHPDLAHIRIRRLQEDGSEKVIDVNLAETIANAAADITPETARKADVILLGGDVVEIPLKKDAAAGPWKGFTPAEERFFAKALSGKVQLTDDQGNVWFSEIDYRTPRLIDTEVGLLPLPAATGTPTARGWWITFKDSGRVFRSGVAGGEIGAWPASAFLRDGDAYRRGSPRPPQPGVVPPPAPVRR